jgi:hypothetical protein
MRNGCACFSNRPSNVHAAFILTHFSQCHVEVKVLNIGLIVIPSENRAVLSKVIRGRQNDVLCL